MEPSVLEETQSTLFDLSGEQFNINWVDEKQPLFIANNPLHWKGHKLQILIARLDRQAANNAAQFNSKTYYEAVNELERIMTAIKQGEKSNAILEPGEVAEIGDGSPAPPMGEGTPASVDIGISADNPISG